jgi:hypothetical protein
MYQKEDDDLIRSVTYFSKTLFFVECNYEIYDKELLIIIKCFEQWQAELHSIELFTNVLTDHKSLKYFMIIKQLNKRQVRWAEFLAKFDFKIVYQSDKKNDKANSLTRWSSDRSSDKNESNSRNKYIYQIVLFSEKVNARIFQEINDIESEKLKLFDRIKNVNQTNANWTKIKDALKRNKKYYNEMLLKNFKNVKNTLFYNDILWVSILESRLNVIREVHDQSTMKHSEIIRIYKFVKRLYYWSEMRNSIERYVRNCHVCKRFKASRDRYSDLLNSLSISNKFWTNITMNFVIDLFQSKEFNVILMIINRLTKMRHYIFCRVEEEDTSAEETTHLLINHVWKLHDLSEFIMSNKKSQFISLVWKSFCKALRITIKLSIAFHSKRIIRVR